MPQDVLDSACKLSATYETVVYPELCTFGVHTGKRDPISYDALCDVLATFLDDMVDILCPVEGRTLTISEWSTVGFTGWHQVFSRDDSANTYGSGDEMPHQLQCVGSVINDTESGIPVGRRRNRSYVGPVNAGTLDSSEGRLGSTLVADALSAWGTLDDNLTATLGWTGGTWTAGLCVVSPTAGLIMQGDRVKVGAKYDIHRSRAQKTPESYSTVAIYP
jgi:hypothetical protein